MSELVEGCPRCGAQAITFDVKAAHQTGFLYGWQLNAEVFAACRNCHKSTTFFLVQKNDHMELKIDEKVLVGLSVTLNNVFLIQGFVSSKDRVANPPPDYLPPNIDKAYREGALCSSIRCYNAAATMFRLCLDLATRPMLPAQDVNGMNNRIRRSLGLRLEWLFRNNVLPAALEELSHCVKNEGNDGAHEGTLEEQDAADLNDFAHLMLERIYTEPRRIAIAKERMDQRKNKSP
ncbi:DUF4145 domain-containing protein [Pseudomonas sp. W5-01]|uniref:DUF4145 domain-containing protein n=1 Tax=Pseudomonas sp. W5-01 TaxID=3097454 RepID=UPI00397E7405